MEKTASTITKVLLVSFGVWYLLRRTNLGLAFSNDILAIPQQLGVAEGLKSAMQPIR